MVGSKVSSVPADALGCWFCYSDLTSRRICELEQSRALPMTDHVSSAWCTFRFVEVCPQIVVSMTPFVLDGSSRASQRGEPRRSVAARLPPH